MGGIALNDVQGLAAYGYGGLKQACYLLLRVRDARAAGQWIASAPVSTAEYRADSPDTALQIAFTSAGLRVLGLPERIVSGFSAEFLAGMTGDANRSRRLGDIGANGPQHWFWGAPGSVPHALVMFFARQNLEQWMRSSQQPPWDQAFETMTPVLSTSDMGGHEPFGFQDGISEPQFDWNRERVPVETTIAYSNEVALGELLLGYPNEYGKYTDRPLLDTPDDPHDELPPAEDHAASKDLGLNGTYLVMRQLEQDVRGFWQYLSRVAGTDPQERYRMGAAMVGRQLDGEPLIPPSREKIPGVYEKPGRPRNQFTYDGDVKGTQCPFGAHIRRANPRNADMFGRPSTDIARAGVVLGIPRPKLRDDLIASTRFHRILRRGREYGSKLGPEEALLPAPADEPPRGLHFVCLGANIGRQFEFVQNAWLMSTKFDGLTGESDPLLGNRAAVGGYPADSFYIPREGKVARRISGLPQFVTVRGGAYFFLPGLRALRYIARASERP